MPRTFTSASSEYVGFAPQTWATWTGAHAFALIRRNASGAYHTIYYAGASGGAVNGNVQLGIDTANDTYFGCSGGSTTLATTVQATVGFVGGSKSTGTVTPTGINGTAPFIAGWATTNMAGTLANPATTASAVEEVGRWNGASDYFAGDIEWVGIWGDGPAFNVDQCRQLWKVAPRFLAGLRHDCRRFWWFNQYVSDTVPDRSGNRADQIARTGTTQTATHPLFPGLLGTVFNLVPGVL